jgi:hypothetical protein
VVVGAAGPGMYARGFETASRLTVLGSDGYIDAIHSTYIWV